MSKPIASARIYATALGAYKIWVNGKSVGDQILAPGWTDFRERVMYQAYDVTANVKAGKNAIAAELAPGWYTTPLQWYRQGYNYGKTPPALRAQLRIEYKDGSVDTIFTDERWKAEISPILTAEIYDGETYDARKVRADWNLPGLDDRQWKAAEIVEPLEPEILWQYFQPIRVETVLDAKEMKSPAPGIYVFDFGQNLSGVPRIRAEGAAGTDVKLRFAEILNPDGTLYVDNLRTAKATDHFILAGKGTEEYQPSFTFHGFRYIEISGLKNKSTAKRPESGSFSYRCAVYGKAQDWERYAQSVVEQYFVGTAVKLHWSSDGLPTTGRAAGMVGGCASILAHGVVQHGPGGILEKIWRRLAGDPSRNGNVWDIRAGYFEPESRLRNGVERCGSRNSMDFMDSDR